MVRTSRSSVLRTAAVVAVPLLATALLAPAGAAVGDRTDRSSKKAVLDELADYPRPTVTGTELANGVAAFSSGNALRITGTPMQTAAHEQLRSEAEALGLQVETKTYKGVLTSLVITKPGTDRADEAIVFGAHLDSMVGTIEGAYDNASGVRTVMGLAKAFAAVPTHRTLEFHLYNGEEEGALGSDEVARDYLASGRAVSAYLGFDMVGIGWPVAGPTTDKNCLCLWRGARDEALDAVISDVNFRFLGLPQGKQQVSLEGRNVRNSDEASWADAGFRTVRWAGMRKAADYPEYHKPRDNMATIDRVAGGREFFEQGLGNTLLSAYYTAAALDLEGVPAPKPVKVKAEDRTAQRTVVHTADDGHTH